ncbi:MAG TPA: hypothetical protein VFC79_02060 [Tissierellaceae bacterium]|nr:hypothetical protein [Tissierellaceae bacterium]
MSKIKVGELREVLKELESKQVGVETISFHGLSISVKQFIPIQEKINLVASIFESSIDRSGDLHILDGNKLDIAYKNLVVGEYSNLTLPKNTLESYDMLCESGLFNVVYDSIPLDERLLLENVLDNYIDAEKDEYDQRNGMSDRELRIENVIKDGIDGLLIELTKFIDRLPERDEWGDIMKDIPQSLDGLFNQIKEGSKALEENEQDYLKQLANTVIGDMANKVSKI